MAATKAPRTSMEILQENRPRFPEGLRVLLVEPKGSSSEAYSLLQGLKYEVMAVEDLEGALVALQRSSAPSTAHSYDVVLADATLLGSQQQQLFSAAGALPVALMGEHCSPAQVLQAVEHGAADFLERPLSQLKLRNLWQHTVRMMMSSDSCQSSPKTAIPSATAAPASASSMRVYTKQKLQHEQQHPAGQTPADLQNCHLGLLDDSCDITTGSDCLDGLALPPLLPSRLTFDPDSILLDLGCPVTDNEPSLDDILQPCTSLEDSAAATAELELLGGYSSDEYGCSSGATTFHSSKCELDSCADTVACMPGMASSGGDSSTEGLGSYTCTAPYKSNIQLTGTTAAIPAVPASGLTAGLAAGWPVTPPMGSGHFWGMPPVPQGMVWGMPILNVATVPGIVVRSSKDVSSGQQTGGISTSSATPTVPGAAGAPVQVAPSMCWPMMTVMMPNSGAGAATTPGCMPYPCMPFSGMFPAMGGYMGPMCPSSTRLPVGMLQMQLPGSWTAAGAMASAAGSAKASLPTPAGLPAATPAALTPELGSKAGTAVPVRGCGASSFQAADDGAGMCSIASSGKSACSSMLCTDSLFGPGPADRLVC